MKTKGCKDIFDAPNKGPHYTFIIGNDQILQNKLESAVSEGKLQDFNFLSKSNWSDIFISLLPIIIIIGVWIFFIMRKCQGGGGSGQIFNIGKAKLFDEKQM
jgi:cell division protease FtsH